MPAPAPASSYEVALKNLEELTSNEHSCSALNPACFTQLLTHGKKVENVIVFYHGFTNCPQQFVELGKLFFEKGYNVLIPLQPHHGELNRMNPTLPELTAEELAAFGMQTIDIAKGLGKNVVVSGLSGGGSLTTWLAQVRDDINISMPISPFLGIRFVPRVFNRTVARILSSISGVWVWWDPIKKERNPYADEYQYPRFPTRAVAQYMRLGYAAEQVINKKSPAGKIIVVMNDSDLSVSNKIADQFIERWERYAGSERKQIESYRFDKSLGLPHDIITPHRFEGNLTIVYPKLLDLLGA